MAKGVYIGIDGLARKIKKGYIGVDGIARKIKKAYIGIGGVARPCWNNNELTYYGTITSLKEARCYLAATTVGNYALFGGGSNSSSYSNAVDAYDKSLTRTAPSSLANERCYLAATTVGNYALFGGGYKGANIGFTPDMDAYDTSLTKNNSIVDLSVRRRGLAATTVGNYALFGGGYAMGDSGDYLEASSTVDAYDASLTRTIPTGLSQAQAWLAATTIGGYALFGSGATVDAYDASLTRTTPTGLSQSRHSLAATTVGDYALFGGGEYFSTTTVSATNIVDAYDASLTRTIPTELSQYRCNLAATTVGDYALFGGGAPYPSSTTNSKTGVVDAYDKSLTRTIPTKLGFARESLAATTVGDYALFGGGYSYENSSILRSSVDAYTIS